MGPLALLSFAALCAGLGRAEVVGDFSECKQFFYEGEAPQGFGMTKTANICQRYENSYYFATLYDKSSRIPVWSAYTLDPATCQETISRKWKVEPQLLSRLRNKNMEDEGGRSETLKNNQALSRDYEKTGFDRGHLNPNAFQCDDGRAATFTLTNVAPMDPCFNRVRWSELEKHLKAQLKQKCSEPEENAFLVTGVVPNNQHKIPREDDDNRRGIERGAGRVAVPSHIWTAVCCNHSLNNEKFAFAFLGENRPDSTLEHMTVTQLSQKLKGLYRSNQAIQIFKDGCNEGSSKAQEVLSAITNKLCGDLPNWVKDACQEEEPPNKKPKITG